MAKTLHPKPPRQPKAPETWTEARVFELLKGPFPDGAFVRIPGVRNGTGWQRRTTTADALIVSCWPSRGLWFAGVEIKVSRGDWKRELAKPDKSAEIQKWCNYWYVAAPAGVVPLGELPPTWGLIECSGRGCKIVKAAPKLEPKPADTAFVCSVLRRIAESMVPRSEVNALVAEKIEQHRDHRNYELERKQEKFEAFEKAMGISLESTWEYGNIAAAVELVKKCKSTGLKSLVNYMRNEAEGLVKGGCEIMALCDQAIKESEAPPDNVILAIAEKDAQPEQTTRRLASVDSRRRKR